MLSTAEAQARGESAWTDYGMNGTWKVFPMDVVAGTTFLDVVVSGGTGTADLYVRAGAAPDLNTYECSSARVEGKEQACHIQNPTAGTWYFGLYARTAFQDVTVSASWTTGRSAQEPNSPAPEEKIDPNWRDDVLAKHNALRADHCAPALAWDDELAASAQRWADGCNITHESNTGLGENLSATSFISDPLSVRVQGWYDENVNYNFEGEGGFEAPHFTQVVWRSSTALGCGVSVCPFKPRDGDEFKVAYLVCRYAPQGNITGLFTSNVAPKRSDRCGR